MSRAAARAARVLPAPATVRIVPATALARVLGKDKRTIARWCDEGDIDHFVRGTGRSRRYDIIVRDGFAVVCGVPIAMPE